MTYRKATPLAASAAAPGPRARPDGFAVSTRRCLLPESLDGERHAVAATETERCDATSQPASFKRVQESRQHARSARAYGMSKRHRATIHIDSRRVEAELAQHCHRLHRESLVQFNEIDVLQSPTNLLHQPANRLDVACREDTECASRAAFTARQAV